MNIKQVCPNIDSNELALISECISQNWLTEGPKTKLLAETIKEFTGAKYSVMAPNGTLGLYLSLLACEFPPGSEVIIPSFTFYATAMSVLFAGLKPVIVDVDPHTYELDPICLKSAINNYTVAVIPVHIYGHCANMKEIIEVCTCRSIVVIEDAAQAMGVYYSGKHAGTIGDIGVISFFADKTITTGEGAVLLTNNDKIYNRLLYLRNQGRINSGSFIHEEFGMNFRITDMQAAVGLSQMQKLESIISKKLEKYEKYRSLLEGVGDICLGKKETESSFVPFRFFFTSNHKDKLSNLLKSEGVETRSYFYPMHLQPKLISYSSFPCPVAESLSSYGLCLPIHNDLNNDDIEKICRIIINYFNNL